MRTKNEQTMKPKENQENVVLHPHIERMASDTECY